jgi:DNA-binding transcriptional MerR regulator
MARVNGLVPIGRFSQVARLSVKALRLYDEQGLLRPALVDRDSGYRYYALSQAVEAERIRLLRSLDLSLEEIRRFLGARDPVTRRSLLRAQGARLEARIAEQRRILDRVEALAVGDAPAHPALVTLADVHEQQVLSRRFRTPLSSIAAAVGEAFGVLYGHLARSGARPVGPPLALYHGAEFDPDDLDVELCLPVDRPLSGAAGLDGRALPAATVASTLHAGRYEDLSRAHAALQAFAAERGHEIAGPSREIYLVGPGEVTDPADFRTEVQLPVR